MRPQKLSKDTTTMVGRNRTSCLVVWVSPVIPLSICVTFFRYFAETLENTAG